MLHSHRRVLNLRVSSFTFTVAKNISTEGNLSTRFNPTSQRQCENTTPRHSSLHVSMLFHRQYMIMFPEGTLSTHFIPTVELCFPRVLYLHISSSLHRHCITMLLLEPNYHNCDCLISISDEHSAKQGKQSQMSE